MCKPLGNEKLQVVALREMHAFPLGKGWGGSADINGNIEDLSFDNADELGLPVGILVVQAPQCVFYRERLVVLHKTARDTVFPISMIMVGLEKKAPWVCEYFRLNDDQTIQASWVNLHL